MTLLLNIQPAGFDAADLAAARRAAGGAVWIFQPWEETQARAAMASWPEGLHIARPYPSPRPDWDPRGFAAVIVGNEPNNPAEPDGAGADWPGYVRRTLATVARLRALAPDVALISPALSPGVPGWADHLADLAPIVDACDLAGVHRYAGADTAAPYRARWPKKPLAVTEQAWPGGDPLWVRGDALIVALFAWRWQGNAGAGFDLAGRPDVLARMAELRGNAPQWPATGLKGLTPMVDYKGAIWRPSPNYDAGRGGSAVSAIVPHGTAGGGAVQWFENPASRVSAHYVIEEDGTVYQCVAEADTAWHAGVVTPNSPFAGGPNPNLWTIGVEHVRDVSNSNAPMPPAQIAASVALVRALLARYGPLALIPHDAIDVGRVCPGPSFPLDQLRALLHEAPPAADPTTQAAIDRARAANSAIAPNTATALWSVYLAMTGAWIAGGRRYWQDPTPWLRDETSTGHDAYLPLMSGIVLHWHEDGTTRIAERAEHAAIALACGWGTL